MSGKQHRRVSEPLCTPPLSRIDPYEEIVLKRRKSTQMRNTSIVRSPSGGSSRSHLRSGSGGGGGGGGGGSSMDPIQKILNNRHHSKREAIAWLQSANFKVPEHCPSLHSVDNLLLNGTLALEIVAHCEAEGNCNIFLQKYTKLLSHHPRTMNDCRHIYSVILETVFRGNSKVKSLSTESDDCCNRQELSKKTFNIVVEEILSGDEELAWCLIWLTLRRYPSTIHGNIRSVIQTGSVFQGYSHPGDMFALEACILDFLTRLGVVKCFSPPLSSTLKPTETRMHPFKIALAPPSHLSSSAVMPFIRNGTLLCEIAEKVTYEHVVGVFQFPKIEKTCLINIKKALTALRNVTGMSKVYLSEQCVEDIFSGNPSVILPLLEDVMRYSDRFTPRRHRVRSGDIPYLGSGPASVQKQTSHPTPSVKLTSRARSPLSDRSDIVRSVSPLSEPHSHGRYRARSPHVEETVRRVARSEKVVRNNYTPPVRSFTPPNRSKSPVERPAADFFTRKLRHPKSNTPVVGNFGGYSATPRTISPVLKPQDLTTPCPSASPLASWVRSLTGVDVDFSGVFFI